MKKALIIENRNDFNKIMIDDSFIRADASTQKIYYSEGRLRDGTVILGKGRYVIEKT